MSIMHFVPVGDTKLALHDFGGEGPPLLILHCNGFPARTYLPLARRLATAYHCYGLDFRGHDESAHAPWLPPLARPAAADAPLRTEHPLGESAGCHLDHFVEDIFAVVQWLTSRAGCGVVCFGHSLGGTLALAAELRRPGIFAAMFVYEPVISDGRKGEGVARMLEANARKRKAEFPSKEAACERFRSRPPFQAFDPEALQLYIEHGFQTSSDGSARLVCTPQLEAHIYLAVQPHSLDAWFGAGSVQCPVTAASGGDVDGIHGSIPAFMPLLVDKLPLGRFEQFEGLGHFGTFEDPDRISARALHCLGDAGGRSDMIMPSRQPFLHSRL